MLLGVYFHGALAYAEPSRAAWIATNPVGSVAIDVSVWWLHLFRMGLFFFLSGYLSKRLIEHRGVKGFLWNRGLRIALPFVVFWPVLWLAMAIVFVFAFSYIQQPEGWLGVIVEASRNPSANDGRVWLTTMHLWFLYYLLMFSVLGAIAYRANWWKSEWFFRRPALLLLPFGAMVAGVMGGGLPVAAPESFVPTWWPFAYHGVFYWMGWQLFGREPILDRLQPKLGVLLLFSLLLLIPHYCLLPALDTDSIKQAMAGKIPTPRVLESVLAVALSLSWTACAVLLGQRFLARSNAWLKFCADGSYWVYLIHLPILLFLQTLLIPMAIPVMVKLVIVVIGTWLFCVATYVVFVRYTPIGWMLHGKRAFP
jgi:peptidoglycan/LPS O-acetylase OafA/YrhL